MGEQGDGKVEAGDTEEQKRVGVGREAGFKLHLSVLGGDRYSSTKSTSRRLSRACGSLDNSVSFDSWISLVG